MASAEITPVAQKIDRLIKRIEDGDIKIPDFQRGYVWKQDQVIELLDSIRSNYPIGSVLLWTSNERLQLTRNIAGFPLPDKTHNYPVNYVLDGQQRLSSIYAVFSGHDIQDKSSQDYNPDTKIFDIYYDFQNREFITGEKAESITDKSSIVCLRNLLDTVTYLNRLEGLDKKYHQDLKELYSKFSNYEVPVVTIQNRQKEEVGIIFERINNTGTKMNVVDIMVALTWSDDFHLKEAISKLLEMLKDKGFGNVPTKVILQALSGIVKKTTKTTEILKLDSNQVRTSFEILRKSLLKVVDFLSTEFNCSNSDLLPHFQQIVGLAIFFSIENSPSSEQIDMVKTWFWKTAFSRRYSGQTDQKMDADIECMEEVSRKNYSLVRNYSHSIQQNSLISVKFSKGHPYVRAFLLLMAMQNPLDLVKGTRIDTGEALSAFNKKEYHHVFPEAFLSQRGVPREKINSLVNFCFLPSDSNKKISKKAPSDYFFTMVPQSKYQEILRSNILPVKQDIYKTDDFDLFLRERALLIIQRIDELTAK